MVKKSIKVDDEKEKWDKLQHYKCTICKEEFYFIKKEALKDLKEDEFSEEPFTHLPIFKDEGKCPFCMASQKRLLIILSDEEKREKEKQRELEKKAEKEKLKEELEKLKEEEERLDKLHKNQLEALINEIISDTFHKLDDLEKSLRKGDITIDRFEDLFFNGAFDVMQTNTKMYNDRNREVSLVLSNSFKAGFREAILDFNSSVRYSLAGLEKKIEVRSREKEQKSPEEISAFEFDNRLGSFDKEYDSELKDDIKKAKSGEKGLEDDFKRNLKKELR